MTSGKTRKTNSDFCFNFCANATHTKVQRLRQIKTLGEA